MGNGHEPLAALGPVNWEDLPHDGFSPYLQDIFEHVLTIIESIPSNASANSAPTSVGRSRAKTESAVSAQRLPTRPTTQAAIDTAQLLRKDWKEVKVGPKENPLGINVFKLSAKDGKGAWFARQSIHENLTFDQWKRGLQKEFAETMKVQGNPGDGSIRGIGADKNVEHSVIENTGEISVFQLSAQFPGPTSPRDFVTLLLTSDMAYKSDDINPLRQYVVVSKPCVHGECPPRQGIIRGHYESVEIIREVPVEHVASKRSLSSTDLLLPGDKRSTPSLATGTSEQLPSHRATAVEWLMVTRSDPGGSVPRFLIEKGTPPGICGDAGKFLQWVRSDVERKPGESSEKSGQNEKVTNDSKAAVSATPSNDNSSRPTADQTTTFHSGDTGETNDWTPISNGLYGIISGIFGTAASIMSTGLQQGLSGSMSQDGSSLDSLSTSAIPEEEEEEDADRDSDVSSINSFSSALEKRLTLEAGEHGQSVAGSQSEEVKSITNQSDDKDYKRLQEKRAKLDKKLAEMQERVQSKRQGDKDKDEATLNKMKERYEKEAAKHEAKYKKDLKKLEDKRLEEARKVERKRAKTIEREEKANMSLELERVRAERDMAVKHTRLLENQVRDLQASNTMLAAKLGKLGGDAADTSTLKSATGSNKS